MKKGDWVVIAVCVLLCAATLFLLPRGEADTVEVTCAGEVLYQGSLQKNAVIVTPDGRNTVRIENGRAWMEEADCPDGLCLHMGEAKPNKPVVCLPNKVVIRLVDRAEVDAVTY